MGFRPQRKTYRLKFADPSMDGLTIRTYGSPMGFLFDSIELDSLRGRVMTVEDIVKFKHFFQIFGESVIEWNLDDQAGQPEPIGIEAILKQDPDFAFAMLFGWLDAISSVPAPLERRSNAGGSLEVAHLPMEPLSESPSS